MRVSKLWSTADEKLLDRASLSISELGLKPLLRVANLNLRRLDFGVMKLKRSLDLAQRPFELLRDQLVASGRKGVLCRKEASLERGFVCTQPRKFDGEVAVPTLCTDASSHGALGEG